jgi:uncharacterized protein YjbJ (UPF0337 family)
MERAMNWDRIEGNWRQIKGNLKEIRGKLTDNPLDVIAGKREQLSGRLLEDYGIDIDIAEKHKSEWQKLCK